MSSRITRIFFTQSHGKPFTVRLPTSWSFPLPRLLPSRAFFKPRTNFVFTSQKQPFPLCSSFIHPDPCRELTQEVKFLLERLLTLDLPDTVKMIHSGKKAHLLELSPLFSECILSGDPQIRFYLKEIFKLITTEFINKK